VKKAKAEAKAKAKAKAMVRLANSLPRATAHQPAEEGEGGFADTVRSEKGIRACE
jgi:hypothetical protein